MSDSFLELDNQVPEGTSGFVDGIFVIIQRGEEERKSTYGIISSCRPERNKIGSSVMPGIKVSEAQT